MKYFIVMNFFLMENIFYRNPKPWEDKRPHVKSINFQKLTEHFIKMQEKHRELELSSRIAEMSTQK